MDEQKTNVIDISKFFGGKTLSSADVRVNTSTVLKTEPSFIAAGELARLLDVIATSTEESKTQVEQIKSIERIREREIITQEQSDSRFQQALKSLMDDVSGLKNVYKGLIDTLKSDRKLKEEEIRDRENKQKILKSEESEVQKGMQYQASMAKPTKSFMTEYGLSDAQSQQEQQTDNVSGLIGAAAVAGSAGLIPGFNPSESGEGGGGGGGGTGEDTLTPGSVPGGSISIQKLVSLAKQAGFNDKDAATMAAIAMAESGGNSKAHNKVPPDNSYGLWQINMIGALGPERRKEYGIESNDQLFDPATNARAAKKVYQSQGFGAWTVYKTGAYKNYLKAAQQASENKSTAESGEKQQQVSQTTSQSQTDQQVSATPGTTTGQQVASSRTTPVTSSTDQQVATRVQPGTPVNVQQVATKVQPGTTMTGQQIADARTLPGTQMTGQQVVSGVQPGTSIGGQQVASAIQPGISMTGQKVESTIGSQTQQEQIPGEGKPMEPEELTRPLITATIPDVKSTPDKITPSNAGMEQGNVQIAMIQTPTPQQSSATMSTSAPSQGLAQFSPMNAENLFLLHAARELNIA